MKQTELDGIISVPNLKVTFLTSYTPFASLTHMRTLGELYLSIL